MRLACVGMMPVPATSRTGQLVPFVLGALGGEVDVQRLRDTHATRTRGAGLPLAFHGHGEEGAEVHTHAGRYFSRQA